jgi:EH domain-containing protein 1
MDTVQGTGCGMDDLRQIWELSDIDKDGSLDVDEFCVAMHLCTATAGGAPVPSSLTADIIPPSKR